MKYYLITDNDNPSRTTVIHTTTASLARDLGTSELKTTNISFKLLNVHRHICQKCKAINLYKN